LGTTRFARCVGKSAYPPSQMAAGKAEECSVAKGRAQRAAIDGRGELRPGRGAVTRSDQHRESSDQPLTRSAPITELDSQCAQTLSALITDLDSQCARTASAPCASFDSQCARTLSAPGSSFAISALHCESCPHCQCTRTHSALHCECTGLGARCVDPSPRGLSDSALGAVRGGPQVSTREAPKIQGSLTVKRSADYTPKPKYSAWSQA
jgi:hypothetical protein